MPRPRIRTLPNGDVVANFPGAFWETSYSFAGFPRVEKVGKNRAKLFDCTGKLIREESYWYIKAMECEMIKEIEANRNAN